MCVAQLLSAMVAKLGNMDDPLPQESFEGVDEDEWVSECNGKSCEDKSSAFLHFCFQLSIIDIKIMTTTQVGKMIR